MKITLSEVIHVNRQKYALTFEKKGKAVSYLLTAMRQDSNTSIVTSTSKLPVGMYVVQRDTGTLSFLSHACVPVDFDPLDPTVVREYLKNNVHVSAQLPGHPVELQFQTVIVE